MLLSWLIFTPGGGPWADDGVLKMQTALRQLALYQGPEDGILSEQTKSAIQEFQEAVGLPVTREADSRTIATMSSMDLSRPCWNIKEVIRAAAYPREAARAGLASGRVVVGFTIEPDGKVTDVRAMEASHQIFADAAVHTVSRIRCKPQDVQRKVTVPLVYELK